MIYNEGQQGIEAMGRYGVLHDATIRRVDIESSENDGVAIELLCIPRADSPMSRAVVRFEGVTRIDLAWHEEVEFLVVPGYKAMMLGSGSAYVSLDPYDDRSTEPDDADCSVIEAARIRVELTAKAGSA